MVESELDILSAAIGNISETFAKGSTTDPVLEP